MAAPLRCTGTPGVYARGSRWVAVYLEDGRQRRRSATTFREAREIKVRATAREAARRAGPTVHSYALAYFARPKRDCATSTNNGCTDSWIGCAA